MSLCSLCLSIPWASLPVIKLRASRLLERGYGDSEMILAFDEEPSQELSGFPFHESVDALAFSAKLCSLCEVVQHGVQAWTAKWETADESSRLDDPFPLRVQLSISKLDTETTGFYVWARHPTMDRESGGLYLLATIGFNVDCVNFPVVPWHTNSGSAQCLDLAASWVRDCARLHERCKDKHSSSLPTRIIDVGLSGDIVTLVDGDDKSGLYVCLSYCWGASLPYASTRESLPLRRSGCLLSEMPKTLADAVAVTRHLGIRYIWIDSLCICQDDAEDWAMESARMCDVYSNAHLVIAANHSSDCSNGMFHIREPRTQAVFNLPAYTGKVQATLLFASDQPVGSNRGGFWDEPLAKRGWALQERLLGKKILHYNSRQMYFECNHGMVAEDGGLLSKFREIDLSFLKDTDPPSTTPHVDFRGLLELWKSVVYDCGKRSLSKSTDKLPSMSGLAKLFHNRIGGEYVAGLWSNSMLQGLSWQGLPLLGGCYPYPEYTGPSWSWAAFDGIAAGYSSLSDRYTHVALVKGWHAEPKNRSNPFGEVKPGSWVKIRGPTTELKLSTKGTTELETRPHKSASSPRWCTPYSEDQEGSEMHPDRSEYSTSDNLQEWDLQVMILGGWKPWHRDTKSDGGAGGNEDETEGDTRPLVSFFGLVIQTTGQGITEKLERLGWMSVGKVEGYSILGDEKNWKTVCLV